VTFTADADCVLPVSLEATPAPDNFAVTAPDVTGCEPAASLNATINQPGTIVWTDLAGNPVANPAAVPAGTYIAIATDLAGLCTDTDTTTVTLQDSVDISSQISVQEICNSTTISFANTSGFSGTWNFGDGTGSSTANSGNYTYAGFGNFTVTFTADADCVLPVSLEATPAPDNFAVTAPDVTGCEPSASLNATINQPGTIVWTDLAGNPVANPAAVPAGTYIAIATDLAGLCTDTDTTTVTLQDSVDISSARFPCRKSATAPPFPLPIPADFPVPGPSATAPVAAPPTAETTPTPGSEISPSPSPPTPIVCCRSVWKLLQRPITSP
jgi:hypothetical protein